MFWTENVIEYLGVEFLFIFENYINIIQEKLSKVVKKIRSFSTASELHPKKITWFANTQKN